LRDRRKSVTPEEIKDKVIDIVCEQMGVTRDKVSPETSFINDLGADSLDTVELIMEFEDAFDLNIPDEVAEKIQTIGDAVKYVVENS
jgi:acyl carrier protein